MQASAPLDDDMEALTGGWKRSQATARRSSSSTRLIAEAVGGVCLLALLCWVIVLSVQLRSLQGGSSSIAPECLHALGGGPVGSGGSLHTAKPEHCRAALRAYAQGPYWREVELAAGAAMQTFGLNGTALAGSSGSSSSGSPVGSMPAGMVQWVSRSLLAAAGGAAATTSSSSSSSSRRLGGPRYSEAAGSQAGQQAAAAAAAPLLLSRTGAAAGMAAGSRQQQQRQQGGPRPLVVFDIDETLLSNMPQILDPEAWPWEAWVAAARAEPLQPMLALYGALCRHGYSIALVTGRHEASRNSTMANLQRAGYGSPCSSSSSSSTRAADAPCCYDALLMRPADDSRLASVYKPWARGQLLAGGRYALAALLGDQFSDLNGLGVEPGSGVAAFKLPNPFYFIL